MSYSTQDLLPWNTESILFTSTGTATTETVTNCGVKGVSASEAAKSNGVYLANDITIEVSTTAPAFILKPRDTATWNGVVYTILDVSREEWLQFVSMKARNPAIAYDLRQLATVYRPEPEPDDTGMRVPNLTRVYTDEPCRLQPISRAREWDTAGGERTRKLYQCFFSTAVELDSGDVIEVDGVKYEFTQQDSIEQLGELTVASCERID